MDIQEVELIINPNGQVEISVRGVKGTACLEITKSLEAALGNHLVERKMTAESQDISSDNSNLLPPLEIKG
jgi:hypothetical protein